MTGRFPFLAFAISAAIALVSMHALLHLKSFLAKDVEIKRNLQWDLKGDIGGMVHFGGPSLIVPILVHGADDKSRDTEATMAPAHLTIAIDNDTRTATSPFGRVKWHANTIEMVAVFDRETVRAQLPHGQRLAWERAYLSLPLAYGKTLVDGPVMSVAGNVLPLRQETVKGSNIRFETARIGVPEAPVALRMTLVGADSILTIFDTGDETDITLFTDNYITRYQDLEPDIQSLSGTRRALTWHAGKHVTEQNAKDVPISTFLGMSFHDPDGRGPVVVYLDRIGPAYARYVLVVELVPLCFTLATLIALFGRMPGVTPQLKLYMVYAGALAFALFLAPRIGPQAAWMGMGILMAPTTLLIFLRQGWVLATLISAIATALWVLLGHAPYINVLTGDAHGFPGGLPLAVLAREFGPIILFALSILGLVLFLLQWMLSKIFTPKVSV